MSPPFASDPHIDTSDIAAVTTTVSRNVTHLASLTSTVNSLTTTVDANKVHQDNVNAANQTGQQWQNSVLATKASNASVTALTSVVDDKLTSRYCQVHGDDSSVASRLYKVVVNSQRSTPNERGDGSSNHASAATNAGQISSFSDMPAEFHLGATDSYNNFRLFENFSVSSAVTSGGFTPQNDGIKVNTAGAYRVTSHVYILARNYYSENDWTSEPTARPVTRVNLAAMFYVNHPGNALNGDPANLTTGRASLSVGGGQGRFGPACELSAAAVATNSSYQPMHAMGTWSCLKVLGVDDVVGIQVANCSLTSQGNYEYICNNSYTFLSLELV